MTMERISEELAYPSHYVEVYGSKMHYVEAGKGDPILFLHGIPTSCYVWRNVIPELMPLGRCIAPDLIGFGRSQKPDIAYSIFDHIHYIEKFIELLKLTNIIIVMHGWGSVSGFDYAMRHEDNCKGLVFYEAFLRSLNENDASLPLQEQLMSFQSEEMLSDTSVSGVSFIDKMIIPNVMRPLTDEEMKQYRQPFMQAGTSKPILQYINELHHGKDKDRVDQLVKAYSKKLMQSSLPKLMLYSVPGFIMTMSTIMWAKEHLSNLEIADMGEALHLAQETCPKLMGETISVWLQGIEAMK